MPSNAGVVFAGIMKVATFDIIDTNPLVATIENRLGLKWQETEPLNESFGEMGYETLDPMRNLQLMFVMLGVLCLVPILLKFILILVSCCAPIKNGVKYLEGKLYWNIYIRFILETHLELSIASIITVSTPTKVSSMFKSALSSIKARFLEA